MSLQLAGAANNNGYLYLLDSSGNQIAYRYAYGYNTVDGLNANLAAGTYYIDVYDTTDTAYTLTAVSSVAAGTAPTIAAGRSLSAANSLGALSATALVKTDWVGAAAPNDWYKFSVGGLSTVNLGLSGLLGSASFTLLDASGNTIVSGSGSASQNGAIVADLAAGTYYLHIDGSTDTPFTLTASATALPDAAGHSLASATALAAPTTTLASVSDWVGNAAPNDYYSFTLAAGATVNLQLSGLSNSATLYLYDASGNNLGDIGGGMAGNALISESLTAGTYFVRVNASQDTKYTLSDWTGTPKVGASGDADNAGNTLSGANTTAFGAVGSTAKTVAGWVGATDTDDYYQFSVTGPTALTAQLSGLGGSEYLYLYNSSGTQIALDYSGGATYPASIVQDLASGTYYVDVSSASTGANSGYSLSLVANALANAVGTTEAAATSLGALSATPVVKSDWVGAAAPDDWYTFTLSALSTLTLGLSGLNGSDYDSLTLLDASGNQINAVTNYLDNSPNALVSTLAAGTYFVHVSDVGGSSYDSAYTLSASAAAVLNAIGTTLATATSLGALGTSTASDTLSGAAPVDYYSVSVSSLRRIALQVTGLTASATLTLYDASDNSIASASTSASGDASSCATLIKTLGPGQYFAGISESGSATTPYKFVATTTPILTARLTTDSGSSATDGLTNNPSISGTGNDSTLVHFTIDGVAVATTVTSSATGAWTFVPTGLVDGKHTVIASETDPVGDTGTVSLTFTLDTTAQAVKESLTTDTGSSATDKITSKDGLTGSGDPNAIVHFTIDGTASATTATANATGAWTFTPAGLADGSHTIVASETDTAGNTGTASLTFTLDTTAPAVTEKLVNDTGSSSTDNITSDPTVGGLGDPNAVVHFTIDGTANASTATADATGAWTFTPTGLADGVHTIAASETDTAGNTGSASLKFTLVTTPPASTAVDTTVAMGGFRQRGQSCDRDGRDRRRHNELRVPGQYDGFVERFLPVQRPDRSRRRCFGRSAR